MAAQTIQTNRARQIGFIVVALGCAGIAVWAFTSIELGVAKWGVTIVAGIAALLVWGYGTGTAGFATCPHCGKTIDHIDPKKQAAVLCAHCMEYSTGTDGMLDVTPDNYVANLPVFGAHLPNQLRWPEGCCVCEQPATRMIESKLVDERPGSPGRDLAVGVASLGILKAVDRTTYTIQTPHCSEHKGGAELLEPSGIDFPVAIAFRSYPYYKKFRAANMVPAIKLMSN